MKDLVEAQGTTILDLVNRIFLKGEFVCPIDSEPKEGEIVIGELFDYEKAIILASNQVVDRHNAAVNQANEGGECDPVQKYLDRTASEVFEKLFWANIHYRLGKGAVENNTLGLRKDWKIVAAPEEDGEKDCSSCPAVFHCAGAR